MGQTYKWTALKKCLVETRGHACEVCGYPHVVELDHILPKARGGSDTEDNAVLLCPNCHHLKNRVWPHLRTGNSRMPHSREELIAGIRRHIEQEKDPSKYRVLHPAEDLIEY